jgi:hypothetical protein
MWKVRNRTNSDVRRDADKVRITHLEAEIPEGVEELARKAYAKVRPIKITQLLVEIDQVTHFSRHGTHLHRGDPARDREALFAAMLAEVTNLGLAKMASATPGMTKDRLTWHSDWYLRDECYTKMRAEIVNYHHRHPFSAHWGDGTTSSSDGTLLTNSTENRKGIRPRSELGRQGQMPTERTGNGELCHEGDG